MKTKMTTLHIRFLLRNDDQIIVPMNADREIKTFLFNAPTDWLIKIRDYREGFAEDLFEALREDLYFYEFLIQLFHEEYDLFIASIIFDLEGKKYNFSDICEEYSYWIWKNEPRIKIDEDHGRIEMDIYQFDEYIKHVGMDDKNYEFRLSGKE